MKRVDRILGEARLLRIRRAGRAHGMVPSDDGWSWFDEVGTAQIIVGELSELELPQGADPRRTGPIGIIDASLLEPFVRRASATLLALIDEMGADALVFADAWPKAAAMFPEPKAGAPDGAVAPGLEAEDGDGDAGGNEDGGRVGDDGEAAPAKKPRGDPLRPRRCAVADASALAVEAVLFEVVRHVVASRDHARGAGPRSDPGSIVIEGGRVRRRRPPKTILNASERIKAAFDGMQVPLAKTPVTHRASPRDDKKARERKAALRAEASKASKASKAIKPPKPASGMSS